MAKFSAKFSDRLDHLFMIAKEMIPEHGEDSFCGAVRGDSAFVAVCDGCGGLGSRSYASTTGHTEAYLASRMAAGAIYDWFCDTYDTMWHGEDDLCGSLREYITRVFAVGTSHIHRDSRIRGTMVRDFPTTLAMAVAQQVGKETIIHVVWAGDSRVYLLDDSGLAQLTKDDVDSKDAMSNLSDDGVLTNVLSSDGRFELHYTKIIVDSPAMILAATDGCFGYIPSPMEFEHTLLNAIVQSRSPEELKSVLRQQLEEVAGDDFSFGCMSFLFGAYEQMAAGLLERMHYIEDRYVGPLAQDRDDSLVMQMWQEYRKSYERYLNG